MHELKDGDKFKETFRDSNDEEKVVEYEIFGYDEYNYWLSPDGKLKQPADAVDEGIKNGRYTKITQGGRKSRSKKINRVLKRVGNIKKRIGNRFDVAIYNKNFRTFIKNIKFL